MALTNIEQETLAALKRAANKCVNDKKGIDWEQRRYEIAKQCLSEIYPKVHGESLSIEGDIEWSTEISIMLADELIKQLKGGCNE